MRSLIILEVEHGEDTDSLQRIVSHILMEYDRHMKRVYPNRAVVTDYTVRVDLPDCFRLDK